jgi:lipid II:glycine glycyltransferase (peptidoglycan interpeptide bridge formation enzyme)
LDLCSDEDRLFGGLESSVRTAIRKARHSGVTVQHRGDLDAMRTYYDLHCKTRKRHGLPPQPWAFFLNIQKHILSKEMGSLVLAKINDAYVAGAIFFYTAKKALYKFGASDEVWQSVRANDLVMWEAIKWLGQKGFERLDFGRTSQTNEGLRRFKRGWGAREEVREYVKFALRTESFVLDQERTQGYHNQIFRRLPMRLLRAAGAILYRHSA